MIYPYNRDKGILREVRSKIKGKRRKLKLRNNFWFVIYLRNYKSYFFHHSNLLIRYLHLLLKNFTINIMETGS